MKAGIGQPFDATIPRVNSRMSGNASISVSVVGEYVQWNEEAIARCTLLTPQVLFLDLVPSTPVSLSLLKSSLFVPYIR